MSKREKEFITPASVQEQTTDAAGDAFSDFLASVPADKRIQITVSRLPSDLHPLLRIPEALYPAPTLGPYEEMKEETARRFGAGEYVLHVLLFGDRSRIERRFQLKFRVGGVPGAPAAASFVAGNDEAPDRPPDSMELLRETLVRAAQLRAEASELDATARLAGMGNSPAPAASAVDPLKMLNEVLTAVRSLLPPPAPAGDPASMMSMVKDLFGVVRDLAPEGVAPQGFWSVAMPHIADLLKSYAPYLPHIAAALAQAKAAVSKPEDVREVPDIVSPGLAIVNDTVTAITGGNPMLGIAVRAFLDMAFLAQRKEHTPESLREAYSLLASYADQNFPGILIYLEGLPSGDIFPAWVRLDPRLQQEQHAREFCLGFAVYLAETPESEPSEKK